MTTNTNTTANNNSMINENRFFQMVAPFLFGKDDMFPELIENAIRAKASTVEITNTEEQVIVLNNGKVLEDFENLFIIAQSSYDSEIEKSQKPAGMGILSVISNAITVKFESGNKSIIVDSEKYFSDAAYRSTLLSSVVEIVDFIDGLKITINPKEPIDNNIQNSLNETFKYYDIDILFNNNPIKTKHSIASIFKKEISSGVTVVIPHKGLGNFWSQNTDGYVVWHGKLINAPQIKPFTLIVNGETNLVTPTLPDRKGLTIDEEGGKKLACFFEDILKDEIQKYIDDNKDIMFIKNVLKILKNSYNLDSLNTYYGSNIDSDEYLFDKDCEVVTFVNDIEHNYYLYIASDCHLSNDIRFVPSKIGNSNAPKWVLDKLIKKAEFKISTSDKTEHANTFYEHRDIFNIVESISLNDMTLSAAIDFNSDVLYFTSEFNYEAYAGNNAERHSWEHQLENDARDEVIEDFEAIIAAYKQEIIVDFEHCLGSAIKNLEHTKGIAREDVNKFEIVQDKDGNWNVSVFVKNEQIDIFKAAGVVHINKKVNVA